MAFQKLTHRLRALYIKILSLCLYQSLLHVYSIGPLCSEAAQLSPPDFTYLQLFNFTYFSPEKVKITMVFVIEVATRVNQNV